MKRFISVLGSLLVLPAFAEVTPVYYDDVVEYADEMTDVEDVDTTPQKSATPRTVINRSTSATRAVASGTNASARTNTASRAVASSPRTATTSASRGTVARTAKTSRNTVTARGTATKPVTARVGVRGNVMPGARLIDSGEPQYKAGSSRVGIAGRRASARLSTPVSAISAPTTTTTLTQEEVTSTTNNLTAIAELTDYCKAQYAACMDNYCNVLDDNQGRCSCSKNVKNYEKTEQTLAQATEDFQNVVQQIRYIGLTTDQVNALFDETEAELTMKSNNDSSRLKNSLDSIKKKIVDVSTPSATSTAVTSGLALDMNGLLTADFTAGFDLNSFLNMNNNNTASVSNQRGEQLYKTAAARCKTSVLNNCTAQGIEANIITNAYDLEIDKQCVLYERALNDANAEMKSNVTNAATILQQARLLLAQNKNSYDLRGCVAALDSCMQDEYVCGSDYEYCLDPTGKYISKGEIIKGGTPGVSGGQTKNPEPDGFITDLETYKTWVSGGMWNLYATWNYDKTYCKIPSSNGTTNAEYDCNAWSFGPNENLGEYVDSHLGKWKTDYTKSKDETKSDYMAMYLLQKIGYIDKNDKVHGMCASVFKQCQDYTFDVNKSRNKKTYIAANEVVRQYLNMTLPKIKTQQDAIISDYAEGCRTDVQSCLTSNGYEDGNDTSTASRTAVNACAGEIATCMSVGGYQISDGAKLTLRQMSDWVKSMMITCPENQYVYDDGLQRAECRSCEAYRVVVDADVRYLVHGLPSAADLPNPNMPYYIVDAAASYYGPNETDLGRSKTVQGVSAGGHVTDCSCPEGYRDLIVVATEYKPRSGSNTEYRSIIKNAAGADGLDGAMNGQHVCIDETAECQLGVNGDGTPKLVNCKEKE